MSNGLPSYLTMAKPNPQSNRAPWYKNIAPTYAGIFLWVAFYMDISKGTLSQGTLSQTGVAVGLVALVVAALICHYLFYLVPGMYGMKTGYPLYVIGSSTYGTAGGFLMPGLLMGLLQFGWLGVNIAISANFIVQAVGQPSVVSATGVFTASILFTVIAIVWGLAAAFIGVKGIQYVAKVATFLPIVPLVMILLVFFANADGVGKYQVAADANPTLGFLTIIAMVVGFFATAGAAGVDIASGSRNKNDVSMGGLVGIALAIIVAAGLPFMAIAGAHGNNPALLSYGFDAIIKEQKGLGNIMFVLFAIASFAPACFSSLIAANSIGTMFPKSNKMVLTLIGAIVSIVLAAAGSAFNLGSVFGLIGASFGPICGAMVADYLLSGRKWSGPRRGVNAAGYISWLVGFVVAILPNPMVVKLTGKDFAFINPAPVIAFVIGFVLYLVLAKAGLQPPVVPMEGAAEEAKTSAA